MDVDPISNPHVLGSVFEFLDPKGRCVASQVCRSWYLAANQKYLWPKLDLYAYRSTLTDAQLENLLSSPKFADLQELYLDGCTNLTSKSCAIIFKYSPRLKVLSLLDCKNILHEMNNHEVFLFISRFHSLEKIELYRAIQADFLETMIRIKPFVDFGKYAIVHQYRSKQTFKTAEEDKQNEEDEKYVGVYNQNNLDELPLPKPEECDFSPLLDSVFVDYPLQDEYKIVGETENTPQELTNHLVCDHLGPGCGGDVLARVVYERNEKPAGNYPYKVNYFCRLHKFEVYNTHTFGYCQHCRRTMTRVSLHDFQMCLTCHDRITLQKSENWIQLKASSTPEEIKKDVLLKMENQSFLHSDASIPPDLQHLGSASYRFFADAENLVHNEEEIKDRLEIPMQVFSEPKKRALDRISKLIDSENKRNNPKRALVLYKPETKKFHAFADSTAIVHGVVGEKIYEIFQESWNYFWWYILPILVGMIFSLICIKTFRLFGQIQLPSPDVHVPLPPEDSSQQNLELFIFLGVIFGMLIVFGVAFVFRIAWVFEMLRHAIAVNLLVVWAAAYALAFFSVRITWFPRAPIDVISFFFIGANLTALVYYGVYKPVPRFVHVAILLSIIVALSICVSGLPPVPLPLIFLLYLVDLTAHYIPKISAVFPPFFIAQNSLQLVSPKTHFQYGIMRLRPADIFVYCLLPGLIPVNSRYTLSPAFLGLGCIICSLAITTFYLPLLRPEFSMLTRPSLVVLPVFSILFHVTISSIDDLFFYPVFVVQLSTN